MTEHRKPPYGPELASDAPQRLIPVLQVPREELRRGVRDILFELHNERVRRGGDLGADARMAEIAFWEAVLGWVMEQGGDCVNLVGRAR
jgi:hypothetical protein